MLVLDMKNGIFVIVLFGFHIAAGIANRRNFDTNFICNRFNSLIQNVKQIICVTFYVPFRYIVTPGVPVELIQWNLSIRYNPSVKPDQPAESGKFKDLCIGVALKCSFLSQ